MKDLQALRVWLVHDWLTGFRGGEKVLLELVRLFPRARVATLLHVPGTSHPELDARVARTSFLQHMPGAATYYRHYLPLFPQAIRSLRLDAHCDLVISVSHAVAKGVRPPAGKPHICYCNTPMRYIWGMEDHYGAWRSPKRLALSALQPALRHFDRDTRRVSRFLANSQNVADRIKRVYKREAQVVYPGVDGDFFTHAPEKAREDFFLCAGALVPYKRMDLAIRAFLPRSGAAHERDALTAKKLVIIGTGPEETRLRNLAKGAPRITFLGRQSDEVLRDHYQRCRAFLFPGEEDFGLTPVEAQACGAPVIAYRGGGATETVSDVSPCPSGLFFDEQEKGLPDALDRFTAVESTFNPAHIRARALRFNWDNFRAGITAAIEQVLRNAPSVDR